jgi:hypothetical protein
MFNNLSMFFGNVTSITSDSFDFSGLQRKLKNKVSIGKGTIPTSEGLFERVPAGWFSAAREEALFVHESAIGHSFLNPARG